MFSSVAVGFVVVVPAAEVLIGGCVRSIEILRLDMAVAKHAVKSATMRFKTEVVSGGLRKRRKEAGETASSDNVVGASSSIERWVDGARKIRLVLCYWGATKLDVKTPSHPHQFC
jgi:hypothetical protein